jgi:hypothetical protein
MAAVMEVQKRIHNTLGVMMPLSTFIARATDVANNDLPRSASTKESADELFNQILGLDKVSSYGVTGHYMPQITALPQQVGPAITRPHTLPSKKFDIIDFLAAKKPVLAPKSGLLSALPSMANTTNIFSVTVPKKDEKQAKVFLERVKMVLEEEPGRLVL